MTKLDHDYGDLTVVIPAFNEAEGIVPTLRQATAALPGAEFIVVDDCSADDTMGAAAAFPGVRVVRHAFNRGQGAALKTGMRHATRKWVAWFDADNEHRVEDLQRIYARIRAENLVAVIGQRTNASASLTRAVGKGLIRLIGRGLKLSAGSDLNCGLRIFLRDVILGYLELVPDRFSSSLVSTLIMLERGYPIGFEPVTTNSRIGHSTVRMKDGFEAILQLIRAVLLFAPMRFFLPIGTLVFLLGLVYSVILALELGRGVPVAGVFLMLGGISIIMLGLVADQISQIRLSRFNDRSMVLTNPQAEPDQ
ncbi:MAG: glycosyltransferase family 2 protein [Magnetospirillum sp.]|nr:glycosyltransferase family 2 protein [Magnetospirillum sp.]